MTGLGQPAVVRGDAEGVAVAQTDQLAGAGVVPGEGADEHLGPRSGPDDCVASRHAGAPVLPPFGQQTFAADARPIDINESTGAQLTYAIMGF
ncbi:hypothetical protein Acsp02_14380 [Actinoplanes sp. NBRC 103695]|nr:hypothetical protein Acsp02_14380 [Actinoplanes sp. NBRC 103695]